MAQRVQDPPPTHLPLEIDNSSATDVLHHAIKQACRLLLTGWDALADADIAVSFISGGISNALYKISPAAASPPPVAFRVYGTNTEKFVDRQRELGLMRLLHAHGFGPQLLATFANGRIESFLPLRCLAPEEMCGPAMAPAIAATLARFHATPAGEPPATPATPFARTREWLDVARGLDFADDPAKQAVYVTFDFDQMSAEVETVAAAAAAAASPTVFAHNDLLSGNIMVPPAPPSQTSQQRQDNGGAAASADEGLKGGKNGASGEAVDFSEGMTFIDFEYADWAPRGFDWGNHFCEYAGFDGDYGRYPGSNAAGTFLRAYLAAASGRAQADVSETEVSAAVAEANLFALASHQYWGTWALMQARWSAIDFDYMGYAALRWGEYWRRKEEFLAGAAARAAAGVR